MTDLSAFSLEGRRIAVIGANTGIGQGIAVAIARAGCEVVAVGRSSMDETARMVSDAGGRIVPLAYDLSQTDAAKGVVEEIWREIGPLDELVNNAGIIRRADAVHLSAADWDEVLDLNLKATFLLCQSYARRLMAEDRPGRIVNIASLLSFQGGVRVASYTASKHGVLGLTRVLANEWAEKSINVNAIAPGYIVSNSTEALRGDPDRSAAILAHSREPLGQARRCRRRGGVSPVAGIRLCDRLGHPGRWRLAREVEPMVQSADIFMRAGDGVWETTPDGNRCRVLVYTDALMVVEFACEKGGEGWLHSHPHVQSSYVAEGVFEVTVDGCTEVLRARDSFLVPSRHAAWTSCRLQVEAWPHAHDAS